MMDRTVHHVDVISLMGNNCRLKKHQPTQNHNRVARFPLARLALTVAALFHLWPQSMRGVYVG